MSFRNEIEQSLEQIQVLEESFRHMRDMEMLPLSFFSSSYDILKQLNTCLHSIESSQLQMMERHLKEMHFAQEAEKVKEEQKEPIPVFREQPVIIEEPAEKPIVNENPIISREETMISKETIFRGFLGDVISKKLFVDFKQSLSLNDRFRFQRDLFGGNAETMNATLEQLNACNSLAEATAFLDHLFNWNWDLDSAIAFKEVLEKRFA